LISLPLLVFLDLTPEMKQIGGVKMGWFFDEYV